MLIFHDPTPRATSPMALDSARPKRTDRRAMGLLTYKRYTYKISFGKFIVINFKT
jgi:hypothetical protein